MSYRQRVGNTVEAVKWEGVLTAELQEFCYGHGFVEMCVRSSWSTGRNLKVATEHSRVSLELNEGSWLIILARGNYGWMTDGEFQAAYEKVES